MPVVLAVHPMLDNLGVESGSFRNHSALLRIYRFLLSCRLKLALSPLRDIKVIQK